MSVSETGRVKITFSEKLLARDPTQITNSTLGVKVNSKTDVHDDQKRFSWNATKFDGRALWLQLDFESPLVVSSETKLNLNELEVWVKNPFMFRSTSTNFMVPRNSEIKAEIPPQFRGDGFDIE
jgi:hypothetical protein